MTQRHKQYLTQGDFMVLQGKQGELRQTPSVTLRVPAPSKREPFGEGRQ